MSRYLNTPQCQEKVEQRCVLCDRWYGERVNCTGAITSKFIAVKRSLIVTYPQLAQEPPWLGSNGTGPPPFYRLAIWKHHSEQTEQQAIAAQTDLSTQVKFTGGAPGIHDLLMGTLISRAQVWDDHPLWPVTHGTLGMATKLRTGPRRVPQLQCGGTT